MKLMIAALLLGSSFLLFAQTSATSSNPGTAASQPASQPAAANADANVEAIGNSEIRSAILQSLQDHSIAGVEVQVTDKEITSSGKVASKEQKQMAQDVIAAYADGRKITDHVKN